MSTGTEALATVEIAPRGPARASVIWLHGLGADGHDFEPIVPELGLAELDVRFVFPHAPIRAVTLNAGMEMRAWYDVLGFDRSARTDEAGVRDSMARVAALVDAERERGIPARRIVLAGFSQGGVIALHAGLRYAEPLAGLVGLSTYLPMAGTLETERSEASVGLPVWMAHGEFDPVLPPALGEAARAALVGLGHMVDWQTYPMAHQVCLEEIAALSAWLRERLT